MITNWINTWELKPWKTKVLYFLMGLNYRRPRAKGDYVICFGIGYPHWKNHAFRVNSVIRYMVPIKNTRGNLEIDLVLNNSIRVSSRDFGVVSYSKYKQLNKLPKKVNHRKH